ncbi:hypothetical protein I302_107194 [Kwoniella bestiolae CBS 10118]|uniref:Phytanoyl-CoA dioxygenase n=1 Tax=Kwoniella bestiolae CBS 10118 TaxID=1296100 RepID=A0A1B9FZ81_9TREE|nr:hypothetical protein I302_05540 [Kwoniella bestiolae CBS 10118]OCF24083.1 hypothetical protein I302_05540 [Kwoniella bestiolae CBS 10118]
MVQMITQTLLTGAHPPESLVKGTLKLRGAHHTPDSSAYPDLESKGYQVVKGIIPRERAAQYVDRVYKWLESFGTGFEADDRSTWHIDQLPAFHRGGLFNRYGVGHEQFVWDIRGEEALINEFAKIWGTQELLVSFDGINVTLPLPAEELEGQRSKAWPHVDQSPNRQYKHCIQGIMNLEENGPQDGGLRVLEGSIKYYNEFFEAFKHEMPAEGWTWRDAHWYTDEHLQWFFDRGCKWVKVEAAPGDLILWDSRTIHYGTLTEGDRPRIASYVCYKPASDLLPEMKEVRKIAAEQYISTTHDPLMFRMTGSKIDPHAMENERLEPLEKPVLTERMQQLAGLKSY